MTTQYWIAGTVGDWSAAADWQSGMVPTSTDDAIINNSNAVTVNGSTVANSLMLDFSTLTVSGTLTLGTLTVDSSELTLNGGILAVQSITSDNVGLISGYGTVSGAVSGDVNITANGGTLTVQGSLAAAQGNLTVDSGATLELSNGSAEPVYFNGSLSTLKLDAPTAFTGGLANFALGGTIDLVGISASSASFGGTSLTINESNGQQLTYNVGGSVGAGNVAVASDNHGGTLVSWIPATNPVTFSGATATYYQTYNGTWLPSQMIDGSISAQGNGWAIWNNQTQQTQSETALLTIATPVAAGSKTWTITIYQDYIGGGGGATLLGDFSLGYTTDPSPNLSSTFIPFKIIAATSLNGSTLTSLGNGQLLDNGSLPLTDVYTITLTSDSPDPITGIFLEAIKDPTNGLPAGGPGRWYGNPGDLVGLGNFTVSELTADVSVNAPVPVIASEVLSSGKVTLTGTNAEANDTISVYDGTTLLGTTTTGSNGTWSFTIRKVSNIVHTYTAMATDVAGNVGDRSNEAILGSTKADTLVGSSGNDIINGNGGNDIITGGLGADKLTGGSGKVTFVYNAISDSTPSSHDTITDFNAGRDIIDFTNIAGINAHGGVATFEGKLTGSGNLTLNAHSVAYIEVNGSTEVLVNTTNTAETVTSANVSAANIEIVLVGIHLGLKSANFHHV